MPTLSRGKPAHRFTARLETVVYLWERACPAKRPVLTTQKSLLFSIAHSHRFTTRLKTVVFLWERACPAKRPVLTTQKSLLFSIAHLAIPCTEETRP
jgi:hypothetical protein